MSEDFFAWVARTGASLPPTGPRNHIERQFWIFHAQNPHIYALFCRFAQQAVDRGYDHFGAGMIMQRIRWETTVETVTAPGEEPLKINNNYNAYYARLWMRDHPWPVGFFRLRELPSGEVSERLQPVAV
jgi:hypothetical protein